MKASEQCFLVVMFVILYKLILTLQSAEKVTSDNERVQKLFLILLTLHYQANETQELEDLKKSKEQTEARLNIQISSLNENLAAARTEAEKFQQETKQTEEKLSEAEKRNDELKGEVAGE